MPQNYNYELLEKVYKQITEHRESFVMEDYIDETKCGTVACICGWACIFSNIVETAELLGFHRAGRGILNFSEQDSTTLFFLRSEDMAIACLKEIIENRELTVVSVVVDKVLKDMELTGKAFTEYFSNCAAYDLSKIYPIDLQ